MGLRPERAHVVEIGGGKSGWNTNTEWEVRKQIRGEEGGIQIERGELKHTAPSLPCEYKFFKT